MNVPIGTDEWQSLSVNETIELIRKHTRKLANGTTFTDPVTLMEEFERILKAKNYEW